MLFQQRGLFVKWLGSPSCVGYREWFWLQRVLDSFCPIDALQQCSGEILGCNSKCTGTLWYRKCVPCAYMLIILFVPPRKSSWTSSFFVQIFAFLEPLWWFSSNFGRVDLLPVYLCRPWQQLLGQGSSTSSATTSNYTILRLCCHGCSTRPWTW